MDRGVHYRTALYKLKIENVTVCKQNMFNPSILESYESKLRQLNDSTWHKE